MASTFTDRRLTISLDRASPPIAPQSLQCLRGTHGNGLYYGVRCSINRSTVPNLFRHEAHVVVCRRRLINNSVEIRTINYCVTRSRLASPIGVFIAWCRVTHICAVMVCHSNKSIPVPEEVSRSANHYAFSSRRKTSKICQEIRPTWSRGAAESGRGGDKRGPRETGRLFASPRRIRIEKETNIAGRPPCNSVDVIRKPSNAGYIPISLVKLTHPLKFPPGDK